MTRPRGHRDRDALTVEIVFAVVTGGLLAVVLFFALAGPHLLGGLGDGHEGVWVRTAGAVAAAGFALRVVQVLWWQPRKRRE
ncbi:hypothetical protein HUT19_06415 [Streptomyces sp. NA02950]|uniref:DUF6332 family protein n=1 Tax=Streptomyces sp. NA02950 TaxID=2742137 RepID=UPI00159201E1|nr:DUF6332 family protein [Streptomyces sp. NA02950]QKV91425.1 hypothetical protein HUT19_06415 [Streptomyces sp. NA02950]